MRRLRRLPAALGQRRQLSASGDRAALLAFFAREFVILSGGASVLAMFVAFNAALLEFILEKRDEYEYDLPGELVETRNGMRHVATEALAGGPNDQSDPVVVFLADGDETTDHWTLVRGHLRQAGVASLAYDRAGRGYSEAAQHPSSKAQGDGISVTREMDELEDILIGAGLSDRPLVLVGSGSGGTLASIAVAAADKGHLDANIKAVVLLDAYTETSRKALSAVSDGIAQLHKERVEQLRRMEKMSYFGMTRMLLWKGQADLKTAIEDERVLGRLIGCCSKPRHRHSAHQEALRLPGWETAERASEQASGVKRVVLTHDPEASVEDYVTALEQVSSGPLSTVSREELVQMEAAWFEAQKQLARDGKILVVEGCPGRIHVRAPRVVANEILKLVKDNLLRQLGV